MWCVGCGTGWTTRERGAANNGKFLSVPSTFKEEWRRDKVRFDPPHINCDNLTHCAVASSRRCPCHSCIVAESNCGILRANTLYSIVAVAEALIS